MTLDMHKSGDKYRYKSSGKGNTSNVKIAQCHRQQTKKKRQQKKKKKKTLIRPKTTNPPFFPTAFQIGTAA